MTKKALQTKALKALKEAVREVVAEHKRSGRPLAIWQNGKVIKISPAKSSNKFRVS